MYVCVVSMSSQSSVMKQFMSNDRLIMVDVNLKGILMFTVNQMFRKHLLEIYTV